MGKDSKKGMGWKGLLFLGLLTFIILGLGCIFTSRIQAAGKRSISILNSHSITRGLIDFKTEFGSYPCSETKNNLLQKGITNIPTRHDSNAFLAQLIATELIDSEVNFYCESGNGYHRGDDKFGEATEILAPGENSFAYVLAQGDKPLTEVHNITPLIITPIMSGGRYPTFDPEPFENRYFYGAVDGSSRQGLIGKEGQARSRLRTHLFQIGEDSLFGSQIPDVKIPTRKY